MSVIDDLKDSVPGTGKRGSSGKKSSGRRSGSSNSGRSQNGSGTDFSDTDFDQSLSGNGLDGSDNFGSDSSPNPQGNRNNPPAGKKSQNTRRAHQSGQRPNSRKNQSSGRRQKKVQRGQQQGSQGFDTPNAQAGRPQEGSAQPQLSSQTQKKMDNAGLEKNQRSGGNNSSKSDFEELKRQNEEIIELLKRINQNLQRR